MSITLFELAGEYRDVADKLADMDLPPEVIADTLESMSGALEAKATNVAAFVRNLRATSAQIKEAEQEMAHRRKAMDARADHLEAYLLANLQRAGIQKIECPYFRLSVRANPPRVVVDDERQIPADYFRQVAPPPPAVDKTLIAQALKDGYEVPGARLEQSQRLEIK